MHVTPALADFRIARGAILEIVAIYPLAPRAENAHRGRDFLSAPRVELIGPQSSSCSPLSLTMECGALAMNCPQLNPDNLIWFQLIRNDYNIRRYAGGRGSIAGRLYASTLV